MRRDRFSRFNGRTTFNCASCGRLTRDVDQGGTDCCPQCYELAGYDNMLNDDGRPPTAAELAFCERQIAMIAAKGGDADKARASCDYIWPPGGAS